MWSKLKVRFDDNMKFLHKETPVKMKKKNARKIDIDRTLGSNVGIILRSFLGIVTLLKIRFENI